MTLRLSEGIKGRYRKGLRDTKYMTPLELYVATLFFVIGAITNVGFGNPGSGNDTEMGLSMATMFISMFVNILFISDLSAMKIGEYLSQVEFSNSLRQIRKYLHHERIPKNTCNKIMKYYINFWHQKSTLTTKVYYNILPKALQKEVMLDVFWFALHRMYLFKNESLEFKRLVSSAMEVEYYNKGDLILEHGQVRLKSFFIARGSVCILSQEDSESPVLTLGVGSCFGELHLFYSMVGKFSIVAQTYCILHTLTKPRFWCLINMQCYHRSRNIIQTMNVKMNYARSKRIKINDEIIDKTLIQMKEVLNDETQLDIYDARNIYKLGNFTEFHDSYILSKEQINSYDGIFTHTEWPWKLREDSNFIHIWEYIVIFTTLVLLFYWPLKVLFKAELNGYMIAIFKIYFTLIFGLDVIIQLFTVIETPQKSYITFTEIFEARCTNLAFACDFISALPLDTLATVMLAEDSKTNLKYRIIMFSMRFLKLYRLPVFFNKLELRFMSIKFHIFKCIKHFFFIVCFSYLNGCIYYLILYFHW
ncbi:PREDICTED: potassium channel AKT1-like [Nicrophorus vespilloides]|uniref:Potassium channel AKT1-like n=1 Tax=Nicrophorus vespilloides TaxID=110193 RepID=A0ABM1MIM7_NICVS|nr:PREDICTED: potassium channel AKT1-like [Nicrophorus vespilloides]